MAPKRKQSPHHTLTDEDQEDLRELEKSLDRISDKTPALPYIVTVQSMFEYHPRQVAHDFRDTHWDRSERRLEYSSFLYRNTSSGNTLLQLHGQEPAVSASSQPAGSAQKTPRIDSAANTNPNTPSLGPRKKISLADYKKRALEKTQTPAPNKDSPVLDGHASVAPTSVASSTKKQDSATSGGSDAYRNQKMDDHVSPAKSKETRKIGISSAAPLSKGSSHARNISAEIAAHTTERVTDEEVDGSPRSKHLHDSLGDVDSHLASLDKAASKYKLNMDDMFLELPNEAAFEKASRVFQGAEHPSKVAKEDEAKPMKNGKSHAAPTSPQVKPETKVSTRAKTNGASTTATKKRPRDIADADEEPPPPKKLKTPEPRQTPEPNLKRESTPKITVTPAKPEKPTDTPTKAETEGGHLAAPASTRSKNTQKWKHELKRLEEAGKDLKRESQTLTRSDTKSKSDEKQRRRLSVILGIESILCFMVAFCANDQIRATHASWRSLAGLHEEVSKRAEPYPHLLGLCYLLRASCASRSVTILGSTKQDDVADLARLREYVTALQTYVQRADSFSNEADLRLTRAVLAEHYPKANKAGGAVPFGSLQPMPVVRMAMALLGEWAEQQKLAWTPSLDEGECRGL